MMVDVLRSSIVSLLRIRIGSHSLPGLQKGASKTMLVECCASGSTYFPKFSIVGHRIGAGAVSNRSSGLPSRATSSRARSGEAFAVVDGGHGDFRVRVNKQKYNTEILLLSMGKNVNPWWCRNRRVVGYRNRKNLWYKKVLKKFGGLKDRCRIGRFPGCRWA